jgi:hypothetical protein
MLSKKVLLLSLVICLTGINQSFGKVALSDLTMPKNPAYRVGISDIPENQYVEAKQDKQNIIEKNIQKQTKLNNIGDNDITYSELNIKRLSKEIAADLEFEEQDMVADLSLLWQGAAMQSDTINFALYKLANPDKDKPNKSTVKKVLQTIASMSTLAGASIGNPLLAGTSLISGNVLGIMSQDTKALNYKYTKVTDADMIILIRKVEDLQQNAVNLYYDYMTAKKQLEMTSKLVQDRKERFELAQKNNAPKEIVVVTDAYFRTALDKQKTARSEFLSKRAALEQFVGNETFHQFEEELAQRESGQKKEFLNEEKNTAYDNTIKNVENYTTNLNNMTASTENVPYQEEDPNLSKLDEVVDGELLAKGEKKDKYDTKGLIFLHNKDKETAKAEASAQYQNQEVSAVSEEKTKTKNKKDKKVKQKKNKKSKNNENVNNQEQTTPSLPVIETPQTQTIKPVTRINGIDLMPLDEIKKPDLKPHGYSIFAE